MNYKKSFTTLFYLALAVTADAYTDNSIFFAKKIEQKMKKIQVSARGRMRKMDQMGLFEAVMLVGEGTIK